LQASEHFDDAQDGVALVVLHTRPHPLQFAGSEDVFTSHPSAGFLSQSALGDVQLIPQTPFVQVAVPPTAGQTLPHAPQFMVSLPVLTSHPFAGRLSQSE